MIPVTTQFSTLVFGYIRKRDARKGIALETKKQDSSINSDSGVMQGTFYSGSSIQNDFFFYTPSKQGSSNVDEESEATDRMNKLLMHVDQKPSSIVMTGGGGTEYTHKTTEGDNYKQLVADRGKSAGFVLK